MKIDVREFSKSDTASPCENGAGEVETPTAAASSPSPLSSVAPLNATPPVTSFSLGTSVMTVVGGAVDYFQQSVNDAKDAVEYCVDTLYTMKDAVSEEAQALMQEVSTYIDSTAENQVMDAKTTRYSFVRTDSIVAKDDGIKACYWDNG